MNDADWADWDAVVNYLANQVAAKKTWTENFHILWKCRFLVLKWSCPSWLRALPMPTGRCLELNPLTLRCVAFDPPLIFQCVSSDPPVILQ